MYNPKNHLRAPGRPDLNSNDGSLTFLEFIGLVELLWNRSHPDIPMIPAHGGKPARYPAIVHGLELRKVHPQDPKPRYRESVTGNEGEALILSGQRFQNVVKFTVVAKQDGRGARLASQIIEVFEEFMQEQIPVLKSAGVSELVYSRRYPDDEENRPGADIVRRSVAYLVTTERVTTIEYGRFDEIVIEARTWLENSRSKPVRTGVSISNQGPRYYSTGVPSISTGRVSTSNDGKITYSFSIPHSDFHPTDLIYVIPSYEVATYKLPVEPGYYYIHNLIGTSDTQTMEYSLVRRDDYINWLEEEDPEDGPPEVSFLNEGGQALAIWIPDPNITTRMVDQGYDAEEVPSDESPGPSS